MAQTRRTWRKRLLWTLLISSAVLTVGRCFWVVSRLEAGWEFLALEFHEAVVSPIGPSEHEYDDYDAVEEVEAWKSEAARITKSSTDADLAAAAAILMDAQAGILTFYIRYGIDDVVETRRVQQQCRETSLRYAKMAIEREPENTNWRRLLASLIVDNFDFATGTPEELFAALDECAAHDPGNGLYDYAAAGAIWQHSLNFDYELNPDELTLEVVDARLFALANARFASGQAKPFASFFDDRTCSARFMRQSTRSAIDRAIALNLFAYSANRSDTLYLAFSLKTQQIEFIRGADWEQAESMFQRQLRFADQVDNPNSPRTKAMLQWMAHRNHSNFRHKSPSHFSKVEVEEALLAACEAQVYYELLQEAENELYGRRYGLEVNDRWGSFLLDLPAPVPVAGLVSRPLPVLFLLAFFAASVVSMLPRGLACQPPPIGGLLHATIGLGAVVAAGCLLALSPVGVIPEEAQRWLFTGLLVSSPATVPLFLGWIWHGGRPGRISLRFLLILVTLSAVIMGALSIARQADWVSFARLPLDITVPPVAWGDTDPETARLSYDETTRLALQWDAHGGAYIATLAWLIGGVVVLQFRTRGQVQDGDQPTWSQQWTSLLNSLQTPLWVFTLLLLIVYAGLAPTRLEMMNERYLGPFRCADESSRYGAMVLREYRAIESRKPGLAETLFEAELAARQGPKAEGAQIDTP